MAVPNSCLPNECALTAQRENNVRAETVAAKTTRPQGSAVTALIINLESLGTVFMMPNV